MFKFFSWVKNVNLFCGEEVVVTDSLEGVSRGEFATSFDWQELLVGERKWVERNESNRPPVPWVESSPFRNWVEWTWVDLEKCQVQGRQHIDFDPSPFDPIRPQSIRPKLFDQKVDLILFDLFHSTHFMQSVVGIWNF